MTEERGESVRAVCLSRYISNGLASAAFSAVGREDSGVCGQRKAGGGHVLCAELS